MSLVILNENLPSGVLLRVGDDVALGARPGRVADPEERVRGASVVREALHEQR